MKIFNNSNFYEDTYYKQSQFSKMLEVARKAGKEVLYNAIRYINNCKEARALKGYVSIQDILKKIGKILKRKILTYYKEKA